MTRFTLDLPLVEGMVTEVDEGIENLEPLMGSETVLVVEDEEVVREMATEILRESGYHVLEAKHANDAMILAAQYDGEIHLMHVLFTNHD